MGDPLNDLINDIGDLGNFLGSVAGFGERFFENSINSVIKSAASVLKLMGDIFKTVTDGITDPSKIQDDLHNLGKDFSDVIMSFDVYHTTFDFLKNDPFSAHSLHELDKFSGGMLTSADNVGTLLPRAIRGDAISTQELLRDALFVLEVYTVAIGGGAALGGVFGNMIGHEVCKNAGGAKDACVVAFTIAGAATGSYLESASSGTEISAEEAASDAAINYAETKGYNIAAQQVSKLCSDLKIAGKTECQIVGQISSDFVRYQASGGDESWEEFLASESAKIGVAVALANALPPTSKERQAIIRVIGPLPMQVALTPTPAQLSNSTGWNKLLLIGGGALAVLGVLS